jgi:hypothetical protein
VLYLPWLSTALNAAGWSSAARRYHLGAALLDVLRVLAVGVTQSLGEAVPAMVASVAMLIAGLWASARRQGREERVPSRRRATVGLTAYLVIPLGLFFAFDLYKPAWLKFLIVLLPPWHVLVAHGMANLSALASRAPGLPQSQQRIAYRILCGVLVAALAVLVYPSLRNLYLDPAYARDDYRQLAADVREMWRPGDAIVLNAPNQWEVFTYYYPDREVYPAPYRPGPGKASAFVDPLLDQHGRLFVLYWGDAESDPGKRIESWLAAHAYKAGDQWYGDVRLATYRAASLPQEPEVPVEALFGERIRLQGYALGDGAFAPGEIVPVTLFWEALEAVAEPYKVSVQLLDRGDAGRLVSQNDSVPGDGLAPTTSWEAGVALVDRYGVRVPQGTSSGRYALIVVVYHAVSGERVPMVVGGERIGDHLRLGDVGVGSDGR